MADFFISYSSIDGKNIAEKLTKELEKLGYNVWYDEATLCLGDNVEDKLKIGIENSNIIILLLTENFFVNNWTSYELGVSRGTDNKRFIPIMAGISYDTLANKAPYIIPLKRLQLNINDLDNSLYYIASELAQIDKDNAKNIESKYHNILRKLHNYDTPNTNVISILLTDFDKVYNVNFQASLSFIKEAVKEIIKDIVSKANLYNKTVDDPLEDILLSLSKNHIVIPHIIADHIKKLYNFKTSEYLNQNENKQIIMSSLTAVLRWYISFISHFYLPETPKKNLIIAAPGELTYNDFIDMYEIDKLVLRSDLIAPPDITYNWYQYNVFTHIAVRDSSSGKVIGYFAILPVTDELFQRIQQGDFKDNDLNTDNIRQYNMEDFYKLYIACVGVHPNYQNTNAFNFLYRALLNMMYNLAIEREVYITDIITEASTKQGEKLCKILGFQKLKDTQLNTELYTASLLPPSFRLNSLFGHKLIEFYRQKYNQLKNLF